VTAGPGDIGDPRVFRWVEAGVSGLAALREWDATAIVELTELAAAGRSELDFRVLTDGTVVGDVPPEAVDPLTAGLGLAAPYAARAVRQSEREWIVAGLALDSEVVDLPRGLDASSLEVAVPPEADGEPAYLVDGDFLTELPEGQLGEALRELERRALERFEAVVARADRVEDGRWELTIDPL
jgi:hypothetical protein